MAGTVQMYSHSQEVIPLLEGGGMYSENTGKSPFRRHNFKEEYSKESNRRSWTGPVKWAQAQRELQTRRPPRKSQVCPWSMRPCANSPKTLTLFSEQQTLNAHFPHSMTYWNRCHQRYQWLPWPHFLVQLTVPISLSPSLPLQQNSSRDTFSHCI